MKYSIPRLEKLGSPRSSEGDCGNGSGAAVDGLCVAGGQVGVPGNCWDGSVAESNCSNGPAAASSCAVGDGNATGCATGWTPTGP